MQRVEFMGTVEQKSNTHLVDADTIEATDQVVDPEEIEGIIRRAVTISWRDCAFTYDELAAHLIRNDVVLPRSIEARDELFEEVIQKIWHRQKELARAAFTPLPTRMRYYDEESATSYHGIVGPPVATSTEASPSSETTDATFPIGEDIVTGEVINLQEKLPPLTRVQIATRILELFTDKKVYETVLDIKKTKDMLLKERPSTDETDIDFVVKTIIENGYAEVRNTGKKKHPRWSIVMDQATKQELLADMQSGSLEGGLAYMLGEEEALSLEAL